MGRFRSRQPSEPLGTGERCPMCGVRVPVGPDGRCRLGHRVRAAGAAPPAPPPAEAQVPPAEMEDGIAEFLAEDLAEEAQQVADAQADPGAAPQDPAAAPQDPAAAPEPEPSPPPPAAVSAPPGDTPPMEQTAPWHPYDAVLAAGPPAPGPAPAPVSAPQAPAGGETRSALEDLLWEEPMQSALDMSLGERPAPATEPAIDAAPAPALAPAPAQTETQTETETETDVADDETGSAVEQTAHRRLTVLLGSGALALLALAAFAVAAAL